VFKKIEEEIAELKEVYKSGDVERITHELGDSIFALVNLARFLKIQPELALTSTIKRFIERFEYVEKTSEKAGKKLTSMTLAEMDELWEEAKRLEEK
ncbi:MAG: MazG nucleotide pyrophosphohydrolase domain-containing protein, partial [Clostridia bacterium]